MEQLLQILIVFFFVLLNGFFVAAEFAFVKVRLSQLEQRVAQGTFAAKTARNIREHLDEYLSACQVGITLASLALGWIGEPYIAGFLQPLIQRAGIESPAMVHSLAFGVAFAIITYLHIVVGEMAPKSLSLRLAEKTSLMTAIPLHVFYRVLKPFIEFFNHSALLIVRMFGLKPGLEGDTAHSEEELKIIFAHSEKSGHLTGREVEIMENVLALADKSAKQIMIPRTAVAYLSTTHTFAENLRIAEESQHTRYPLCDGDLDHVVGMIHIKDVLTATTRGDRGLRMFSLKRDVIYYPETISLDALFREFQRTKLHMAVLIDEHGGTTGMVTLEDVLEELVGEIYDEFDEPVTFIRRVGKSEYLIDGLCPSKECEKQLGIELPRFDVETIGGLVFSMIGRIPENGYGIDFDGGSFIVEAIDRQRISLVRLLLGKKAKAAKLDSPRDEAPDKSG